MSTPADKLPGGAPYAIGATIFQLLTDAPELEGARLLDNPVRASDLKDGERVIFIEDQADQPKGAPAQRQYRVYSFSLGVINRSLAPRPAAHQDYRAAKRILRDAGMRAVTQAGVEVANSGLTEGEVRYQLENIDVGGSLVLGLFTLEYRDPN